MNERIDELWQEAVDATWIDNSKSTHEKFAELIVRECAHVAVFKDDGRNVEGYMEIYRLQGRSTAAKMIKEHFGVEE
jgi:hypothetical protein